MVETTININFDILGIIDLLARKWGESRTKVIIYLLKRVMFKHTKQVNINSSVKYQEKDSEGGWHKFHIQLKNDEYEYFIDLRKLLKKSVSAILAYAAKKYIEDVMREGFTDNYPFMNYVVAKEVIGDIICWRFCWGISESVAESLTYYT